ncbi:major histocompatibility complex class I-related gene protein-like isoform 2-T2 [Discoglossus pictus]
MEEKIDHEHWVKQTYLARHYEELHKQDMNVMKGLFNRTYGSLVTHVYQVKFACELFEDGSIRGYEEFGFNGNEFIIFDKEKMVFVPATQEAQIITQKWNSQQFSAQIHKEHMEKDCVEWINKYLHYGKDILERKVPPKVKVSRRQLNGVSKLHCQVYGFYPRAVDVKWVKNGMEDVPSEEAKQILPNPDGTFQIRVSVEVPLGEDSYECHVDHESLDVPLIMVLWEEEQHTNFVLIGLIAAIAVVVVAVIIGFIMFGRRSGQVINRSETESIRVAE